MNKPPSSRAKSVVLAATGLVAAMTPKLLAGWPVILLLASPPAAWRAARRIACPGPFRNWVVSLAVLLLYCAVSSLWAPNLQESLVKWLKLTVICLFGVLALSMGRDAAARLSDSQRRAVMIGMAAGLALLVIEAVTRFFIYKAIWLPLHLLLTGEPVKIYNNALPENLLVRGFVSYALLGFILALLLGGAARRIWPLVIPAGIFILLLTSSRSTSIMVATASGLIAVGVTLLLTPWWRRLFAFGVLAVAMVIPLAGAMLFLAGHGAMFNDLLPTASTEPRMDIYALSLAAFMEAPIFGNGLFSFRFLPDSSPMAAEYMARRGHWWLHPHNLTAQVFAELGLVGACLFFWMVTGVIRAVGRLHPGAQPHGYAVLITALAFTSFSFDLWSSWQLGLLFTAAWLLMVSGPAETSAQKSVAPEAAP